MGVLILQLIGILVQVGLLLLIMEQLLQVDLQERLLKYVLGHLGTAEIMPQVAEQLLFVSVDQLLEHPPVSLRTIAQQELFVGPGDQRVRAAGTQSWLFNRAVHF